MHAARPSAYSAALVASLPNRQQPYTTLHQQYNDTQQRQHYDRGNCSYSGPLEVAFTGTSITNANKHINQ
jgi:hypothetical protein